MKTIPLVILFFFSSVFNVYAIEEGIDQSGCAKTAITVGEYLYMNIDKERISDSSSIFRPPRDVFIFEQFKYLGIEGSTLKVQHTVIYDDVEMGRKQLYKDDILSVPLNELREGVVKLDRQQGYMLKFTVDKYYRVSVEKITE